MSFLFVKRSEREKTRREQTGRGKAKPEAPVDVEGIVIVLVWLVHMHTKFGEERLK